MTTPTFREPISTEGAANRFREPVGELPEWVERYDDERYMLSENDGESVDTVCLTVEKAEALLAVLLDICPNAQNAVDDWLARERLMIVERGGREP